MASIKGKDTKIEILLRKALWREGIRGYRLNVNLPGKPDIVFPKYKIAIFCDGDFWHGKEFNQWKNRLTPYWREKIENNILRDKKNDELLSNDNWVILHFWEKQIIDETKNCINTIKQRLGK